MTRMRWHVIALVVWLTAFFNIERLDIEGYNTINLPSEVYLAGLLSTLLPLLPLFRTRPVWVSLAPSLITLAAALAANPAPDIGDFHTYMTLVAIGMVTVTVVLAHRIAQSLEEFRQAVETVTLSEKGSRLHTLTTAHDLVQIEMSGSRRSQRPLSLVLLQADASSLNMMMHRFVAELQKSMMQRYVLSMAARVISRSLRRTDLVIEDSKPGRLVLLAPETPGDSAALVGERLVRMVQERLGITANFGVATFPQQALTFEDLLERAEEQLHKQAHGPTPIAGGETVLPPHDDDPAAPGDPLERAVGGPVSVGGPVPAAEPMRAADQRLDGTTARNGVHT